MRPNIRQLVPTHAEACDLAQIHSLAFDPATRWTADSFEVTSDRINRIIVADEDVQTGMLVLQIGGDEADVLTLAVVPGARRSGLASALMDHGLTALRQRGVERVILEVASDNSAALALYARLGFEQVGVRKRYYQRTHGGRVDACVMALKLDQA